MRGFYFALVALLTPFIIKFLFGKTKTKPEDLLKFLLFFPLLALFIPLNLTIGKLPLFGLIFKGSILIILIIIFYSFALVFIYSKNKYKYLFSFFSYVTGYIFSFIVFMFIAMKAVYKSNGLWENIFLFLFVLNILIIPFLYLLCFKFFKSIIKASDDLDDIAARISTKKYLILSDKKFSIKTTKIKIIILFISFLCLIFPMYFSWPYIASSNLIIILFFSIPIMIIGLLIVVFSPSISIDDTKIKITRGYPPFALNINFNDIQDIHLRCYTQTDTKRLPFSMTIKLNDGKKYFYTILFELAQSEKLLSYFSPKIKDNK